MFTNIIYFIIVLLLFNINFQGSAPEESLGYTLLLLFLTWVMFAGYCRWEFQRLLYRLRENGDEGGRLGAEYQGRVFRLSILAIFLFALDVYLFHLKYWLQAIPGFKVFTVLQGVFALTLFVFYLGTIWYFSHPLYVVIFRAKMSKWAYIVSNLKINLPILFPWLILSVVYDLISLSPWWGPESPLNKPAGQIAFFASFLIILVIFMPRVIQSWWGCQAFELSEKVRELKAFLHERDFKYRELLKWPIFEGRMMTAGIMGIVPRYRYILITDSLMEILSIEELKAVVAHEMGHAKYRHIAFYILFILGYMVLSYGLFDLFFSLVVTRPFFVKIFAGADSQGTDLYYLFFSLPILATLIIYFRYVMGFFMRNFERQADLYSRVAMGSPRPAISSLEKIALLSGKSRDLPSWHHFSIKDRVDCLWRSLRDPAVVSRHNRRVALSFLVYLLCMVGLAYLLNFSPLKQNLNYHLISKVLIEQLSKEPDNIALYQSLAMIYHDMEKYPEAIKTYEKILLLDSTQAVALNNLAWLMATIPDEELRDPERALVLAKKAVDLEKSAVFLDTLAEAYYVNGLADEAIEAIKEAISLADKGKGYYKSQLEKFRENTER